MLQGLLIPAAGGSIVAGGGSIFAGGVSIVAGRGSIVAACRGFCFIAFLVIIDKILSTTNVTWFSIL